MFNPTKTGGKVAAAIAASALMIGGIGGAALAAAPGYSRGNGIQIGSGEGMWIGTIVTPDGEAACASDPNNPSGAHYTANTAEYGSPTAVSSLEVSQFTTVGIPGASSTVSGDALAQMAYIAATWDNSSGMSAAASEIAFARVAGMYSGSGYENILNGSYTPTNADALKPAIEASAEIAAEAVANAGPYTVAPSFSVSSSGLTGTVNNISVASKAGNLLEGYPVTLTISGPAVFDASGTSTLTLTSTGAAQSATLTSTGNGNVFVTVSVSDLPSSEAYVMSGTINGSTKAQNLIVTGKTESVEGKTATHPMIYDFQPIGTSDLQTISADGTFVDTFDAKADPDYGDGTWLSVGGTYIPVIYDVTAYYLGEDTVEASDIVPSNAEVIGTQQVTAEGPGEISATFTTEKSGFVTIVWSVDKDTQGSYRDLIHSSWNDAYGLANETVSVQYGAEVDSSLSIRETKSGTYLVDDLYISGLPDNHGDFEGDDRFAADVDEFTQSLYFFDASEEVSDANIDNAELIGTVSIPAKNGYYPSVGSNEFKIDPDAAGTYVFVTSFAGDDRVKVFTSSVTDTTEQYVVEKQPPTLQTTATDASDGDKVLPSTGTVAINDEVCYTNLKVGTEYELVGTLMDQSTEEAIQVDGNPITSTVTFTPTKSDDCVTVSFETEASNLVGKTTVVFERLYQDGKLIAVHTDINDEGQTVTTAETPTIGTTATDGEDGDKTVTPDKEVTINDKVCYTGLTPDNQYTLEGYLVDQSTGKTLTVNGEEVTSNTLFTPTEADGCTTVTFKFDGTDLDGTSLVVFETLYGGDTVIASHKDINDEGQTVTFEDTPQTSNLVNTGAKVAGLGVAAGLVLIAGIAIVVVNRRSKKGITE